MIWNNVPGDQKQYAWLFSNLFSFGYFTCYVPFKLILNSENNKVSIHRNIFQKVICGVTSFGFIFHVGIIKLAIAWDHLIQKTTQRGSASRAYFLVIEAIFYIILISTTTWTVWSKQKKIVRMMKELVKASKVGQVNFGDMQNEKLSDSTKGTLWLAVIILTNCVLCGIVASTPYIREDSEQIKMGWLNATLFSAKTMFQQSTEEIPESISFTDNLLIFLYLTFMMNGFIKDLFGELIFLSGCLTLWLLSNDLKKSVKEAQVEEINYSRWISIYRNYKKLKRISKLINDISGIAFLTHILVALLYLPTRIHLVFASVHNTLPRMIVFVYFPMEMTNFVLSAVLCARVQTLLRTLICRRNRGFVLPRRHVLLLTNELNHSQPVSLGGGGGGDVFKINYSLLGKMLEFVATYFLTVAASESEGNMHKPQ